MSAFLVTGADGFIGHHLANYLRKVEPQSTVISLGRTVDLKDKDQCFNAFRDAGTIDYIFHLADVSGNAKWSATHAADQYFSNLKISLNVLEAASTLHKEARFIGFSSLWAYPAKIQKAKESDYWSGQLQHNTQHYGFNKKLLGIGIQACRQQLGLRGTMLVLGSVYGPGDRSDHVIPSLISRMQQDRNSIEIWGNGYQRRDFIYIEDQIAAIYLHRNFDGELLNIGGGNIYSIRDVVSSLVRIMEFNGKVEYQAADDTTIDDRTFDLSLASAYSGWPENHRFQTLEDGLRLTIEGR